MESTWAITGEGYDVGRGGMDLCKLVVIRGCYGSKKKKDRHIYVCIYVFIGTIPIDTWATPSCT